jgi:hypothetical protein
MDNQGRILRLKRDLEVFRGFPSLEGDSSSSLGPCEKHKGEGISELDGAYNHLGERMNGLLALSLETL